jgi:hypothetical protein
MLRAVSDSAELHARLIAHARAYVASPGHRDRLTPYREVLLLWRSKRMSYEHIAAALAQHGVHVSPSGVGLFCRRHLSKADVDRARREQLQGSAPRAAALPAASPAAVAASARGPKIARDNY